MGELLINDRAMYTKEPIRIEAIVKGKYGQLFFVFNRKVEFIHTHSSIMKQ